MTDALRPLEDAVAEIATGTRLAVPPDYSGVAMAATGALLRRGVGGLRLVCCPTAGLQVDVLIGAGAVAEIETAAVSLGEWGPAPRFAAAVAEGAVVIRDATCPAIHAGLQAAEKGVPFMPLRGIIGSDLLAQRDDWRVIENPYAQGDAIVVVPAIAPDVALFHAELADAHGNVWVGRRRELVTMAHAAKRTVVTVEAVYDGDLLGDERLAAGTLPALYVTAVALVPRGAWPLAFADLYPADEAYLAGYARSARDEAGFARYHARWMGEPAAA